MTESIAVRRTLMTVSLAIGLLVATAHARAAPPTADEQSAEAGPSSRAPKAKPAAATKYCVLEEITGSRIPKKICRSREEWIELGVELPVK